MAVVRNIASSVLSSVIRPVVVQKGALLDYLNTLAMNFSSEETYLTIDVDGEENYITFDLE